MDRHPRQGSITAVSLGLTLAFLCAVALVASATGSFTWTSQPDFQSGALRGLDATTSPGDLLLAPAATNWIRSPANPVLGPGGRWEADWVDSPSVLYEGGVYRMWYQGCAGVQCAIGYATSSDGIVWTRFAGNPVYAANSSGWDQNLGNPVVIHDGTEYKMWYAGDGPLAIQIGYATSPDGINWTRYGSAPVLQGEMSWDSAAVSTPVVIQEGSNYTMYFSGHSGDFTYRMGRATSTNGINWTEDPGNPLMSPIVPWEESRVHPTGIAVGSSGYDLYYTGGFNVPQVGHATSSDGRNWTKDAANPVLPVGAPGTWEGTGVAVAKTVTVGNETWMYYGGTSAAWNWRIGMATYTAGGGPVTYLSSGLFVSPVVDSGSTTTSWDTIDWSGIVLGETGIGVTVWVGNSSHPDVSWSPPSAPALFPGSTVLHLPQARFAQVVAALVTLNVSRTPLLDRITLTYSEASPSPPPGLSLSFSGTFLVVLFLLVPVIIILVAIAAVLVRQPSTPAPPRAPTYVMCRYCGAPNPPDHRFCMNCGQVFPPLGPETWR